MTSFSEAERAVLEARCQALGLDPEKTIAALRGGAVLASVALYGDDYDEGDSRRWPEHMVATARREYAA
jgi:hypothetical protein